MVSILPSRLAKHSLFLLVLAALPSVAAAQAAEADDESGRVAPWLALGVHYGSERRACSGCYGAHGRGGFGWSGIVGVSVRQRWRFGVEYTHWGAVCLLMCDGFPDDKTRTVTAIAVYAPESAPLVSLKMGAGASLHRDPDDLDADTGILQGGVALRLGRERWTVAPELYVDLYQSVVGHRRPGPRPEQTLEGAFLTRLLRIGLRVELRPRPS